MGWQGHPGGEALDHPSLFMQSVMFYLAPTMCQAWFWAMVILCGKMQSSCSPGAHGLGAIRVRNKSGARRRIPDTFHREFTTKQRTITHTPKVQDALKLPSKEDGMDSGAGET